MLLVIGLVQKSGYYLYNKDSFGSKETGFSQRFFEKYDGKSDYFLLEQYLEHLRPIVAGIVSMDKQSLCFTIS
jgi:hypothetical protein